MQKRCRFQSGESYPRGEGVATGIKIGDFSRILARQITLLPIRSSKTIRAVTGFVPIMRWPACARLRQLGRFEVCSCSAIIIEAQRTSFMQTVVHVTHEAIQKIGGIGAVLQGLLTSQNLSDRIASATFSSARSGPATSAASSASGPMAKCSTRSLDSLYRSPLAAAFREIEQTYHVGIVYGRRKFVDKETGVISVPEVLLFDVSRFDPGKIGEFKFELWEKFGIDSSKYDNIWDYEQYMRLAQPTIAALHALGATTSDVEPCVILSHEYMGMPTALAAILEGDRGNFRTIFYAHEVRDDAPHRRRPSRPRHDVLQRHAQRDGRGTFRRRRLRRSIRLLQTRAGEGGAISATASSPSAITR